MLIEISIDFEMTQGNVVTAHVSYDGRRIHVIATLADRGRVLMLRGVHFGRSPGGTNSIGVSSLRRIARAVLEEFDYDELIVAGETRTSGANPGRRPNVLRFTRRDRDRAAD